jgi:hypothetical protein
LLPDNFEEIKLTMKHLILLTAAVAFSLSILAQKRHDFKVLKDDPESIAGNIISLNAAHAHFSKREGLKAGIGTEVLWNLTNKIQLQGNLMLYYLSIHNAGGMNYDLEPGVAYKIGQGSKTKVTKVVLSYSERSSTVGEVKTTTKEMEFIPYSSTYQTQLKTRGGLFIKRSGMNISDDKIYNNIQRYTGMGVYGGLEFTSQTCLFSEVDGKKGVTSSFTRYYIDGFLLPVSNFSPSTTEKPGMLGARFGFATYLNPVKKKHPEFGKLVHYQVWPTLFFKTEVGVRSGEGLFFNLGAGLMLFRK